MELKNWLYLYASNKRRRDLTAAVSPASRWSVFAPGHDGIQARSALNRNRESPSIALHLPRPNTLTACTVLRSSAAVSPDARVSDNRDRKVL